MFIKMNDLVVGDGYVIPLFNRPRVNGIGAKVNAPLSG